MPPERWLPELREKRAIVRRGEEGCAQHGAISVCVCYMHVYCMQCVHWVTICVCVCVCVLLAMRVIK